MCGMLAAGAREVVGNVVRGRRVPRGREREREEAQGLEGQCWVVTGGNAGTGRAVAGAAGRRGARVVVACRSAARGQEAVEALATGLGHGCKGCFEVAPLDLARLDSVRAFPEVLDGLGVGRVDVLVNNAGVMAVPLRTVTADGHEAQFQVNYLGHFLLSLALARRHARAHDGVMRVVDVASVTAEGAALCLEDVSFSRRQYQSFGAYAQSKLCTILHAREFHRRWGHKVGQR